MNEEFHVILHNRHTGETSTFFHASRDMAMARITALMVAHSIVTTVERSRMEPQHGRHPNGLASTLIHTLTLTTSEPASKAAEAVP